MTRRLPLVLALASGVLLLAATAAGAHVELDPGEAFAGSTATLTFSFHHGKDGTGTTSLEVLLPPGASVVEVPATPGWTSRVDVAAGTVTWSGFTPDGTEVELPVVVALPTTPGETLFKTIQTTEAGELAWIEAEESEAEGAYPAPRLTLIADPAATTTTEAAMTVAPTSETTETTQTSERPAGTTLEADERDDDTSVAPWLIGSGLAAAAVVGIGGLLLKRRAS